MTRKNRLAARVLASFAAAAVLSAPAVADLPEFDPYRLQASDMPPMTGFGTGGGASADQADAGEGDEPLSPECAAFEADPRADVGDVIRAGCTPTTAQMSALMDNPLGNVAMFFNQFDIYQLKDPESGRTEDKYNYMALLQFPKGISKDWNIINRIVFNVPSMPLDQNKIDKAERAAARFGDLQGAILPPAGSPILPIDVLGGRTTGFGDMYYVGLFSPKKGIKHSNGATSVWGVGFDLMAPTASEELLGTGKWGAGPSALYAYLGKKWKVGALVQQYWDFAGDSDRDDVNLTNLQYLVLLQLGRHNLHRCHAEHHCELGAVQRQCLDRPGRYRHQQDDQHREGSRTLRHRGPLLRY